MVKGIGAPNGKSRGEGKGVGSHTEMAKGIIWAGVDGEGCFPLLGGGGITQNFSLW